MESKAPQFPTTHWLLVEAARSEDEGRARQALEDLCRRYWYPIYAFLRRSGRSPQDAEDLTQGFFHRVLRDEAFRDADQVRGKLRSFLLGVLKRYLSDDRRSRMALKRGGGEVLISIDDREAENRYQLEPLDLESPAKLFDRVWALNLLADASSKLRNQFVEGDNAEAFEHLCEFLPLGANSRSYHEVAASMKVNESVVRLQVHRMRKRYRGLVEEEVSHTVADPGEAEEELEYLMSVIGK